MKQQSVLRGSVWLIGSAVLAKVLGAVFRIPLTAMLGGTGMGYFSCAYGLFLPVFALSVTGINTAVSAVTARSLAEHDPDTADRVYRIARRMFGLGGAVCAVLLFLTAGPLCRVLLHDPGAVPAVRMLSPAVYICCLNAVLRGAGEGSRNMIPTAASQVAEGIGRVVFGLLLCGAVLRHGKQVLRILPPGTSLHEAAAAAAILGVTLSTAAGLLTLHCFPKRRPVQSAPVHTPPSDAALRHTLLRFLLPVAAASLVTNLTALIDLATGLRLLERMICAVPERFGFAPGIRPAAAAAHANFLFGAFSGLAVTVFNLVPAVTNMLGKGAFPTFAASYAQNRTDETALHARLVMRRTAFLALPAGCGITVLAFPVLTFLFPARQPETAAAAVPLMILGSAVIFTALSYPLFCMIQASGHAGDTVSVMLCGAAVKLLCNLLLIPRFGLNGIAVSTVCCYAVILLLALRCFRLRTGIRLHLLRLCTGMLFGSVLCAAGAAAAYLRLMPVLPQRLALVLAVLTGGTVYLVWVLLTDCLPEYSRKKRTEAAASVRSVYKPCLSDNQITDRQVHSGCR